MVIKRIMCEKFTFFSVLSPLTQGRGLKKCAGLRRSFAYLFMCEKIFTFFLSV